MWRRNLVSMDTNLVQYNMCCFLKKSYVVTAADGGRLDILSMQLS